MISHATSISFRFAASLRTHHFGTGTGLISCWGNATSGSYLTAWKHFQGSAPLGPFGQIFHIHPNTTGDARGQMNKLPPLPPLSPSAFCVPVSASTCCRRVRGGGQEARAEGCSERMLRKTKGRSLGSLSRPEAGFWQHKQNGDFWQRCYTRARRGARRLPSHPTTIYTSGWVRLGHKLQILLPQK